jgi:hypothetical protein
MSSDELATISDDELATISDELAAILCDAGAIKVTTFGGGGGTQMRLMQRIHSLRSTA